MSYTPIFSGVVTNGKVVLDERERYFQYLLSIEGKRVYLTVKRETKPRSDNQNAYYWGVVVKLLSDELGYTPEEMHEALKWEHLRIPGAEGRPDRVRSTSAMSTGEMEEYMERVRMWASERFGVYIPLPNEVEW